MIEKVTFNCFSFSFFMLMSLILLVTSMLLSSFATLVVGMLLQFVLFAASALPLPLYVSGVILSFFACKSISTSKDFASSLSCTREVGSIS